MKMPSPRTALGTLALLMGGTLLLQAQAAAKPKPPAMETRSKGKLKPVDINSATKEEISFMLGIDVGLAAKIVAGRPYLTKARLVTQNIVSAEVYASIKDKVVAKQSVAGSPSVKKPAGK
jgi:DNA uptake protein ComE-like DNA-binding protein